VSDPSVPTTILSAIVRADSNRVEAHDAT
jgi:hypothetical protein